MFSTFDLRLLLYVIRLAGWLKHCNLSLSLLEKANKQQMVASCWAKLWTIAILCWLASLQLLQHCAIAILGRHTTHTVSIMLKLDFEI